MQLIRAPCVVGVVCFLELLLSNPFHHTALPQRTLLQPRKL